MTAASPSEIVSLVATLRDTTPLVRLNNIEAAAVFQALANAGYVVTEPGAPTGNFLVTDSDFCPLIDLLRASSQLARLNRAEARAVFAGLQATGYLIANSPSATSGPGAPVTWTTQSLAIGPGIVPLTITVSNNGELGQVTTTGRA
jgi:hypothetical protein